jgi:predicted alpha/beta-fold hydrolase
LKVPHFQPARFLKSGHRQTLYGSLVPARQRLRGTVLHHIQLSDNDVLVVHDNCPDSWRDGGSVVILLHGLTGSHHSGYMVRCAAKLNKRGVRTFRVDHRGCGAGVSLATQPYHAGKIDDLQAVVETVERLCPGSPVSLVGFSLSGNLVLRYLGNVPDSLPQCLHRAVAVCPPVDLQRCTEYLQESAVGKRYDRYFTRRLVAEVSSGPMWRTDLPLATSPTGPQRLQEFDDLFTAPAWGFNSALHYYAEASSISHLGQIQIQTMILAAEDDPVVDAEPLRNLPVPNNVKVCLTKHGGHLGFVGRQSGDPDRRWMDWRVVEWLTR